jgi:hypothetical protein
MPLFVQKSRGMQTPARQMLESPLVNWMIRHFSLLQKIEATHYGWESVALPVREKIGLKAIYRHTAALGGKTWYLRRPLLKAIAW